MRYRLRTLLISVTLAAAWLGYHMHWIRQRSQALAWVGSQANYWDDMPLEQGAFPGTPPPWRIRLLGAEGVKMISVMVYREEETARQRELDDLFPEAEVHVYVPGPGYHGKRAR